MEAPLLLRDHHAEIAAACAALRASAFVDDPCDVVARYRTLEHAVLEHMQAEEDHILPDYARHDAADAASLRATHAELRRQLFRMGVDAELHTVRLAAIDQLLATLNAHAAQEDRGMYPWARANLNAGAWRNLVDRISQSLRILSLLGPASDRPVAKQPVREIAE